MVKHAHGEFRLDHTFGEQHITCRNLNSTFLTAGFTWGLGFELTTSTLNPDATIGSLLLKSVAKHVSGEFMLGHTFGEQRITCRNLSSTFLPAERTLVPAGQNKMRP